MTSPAAPPWIEPFSAEKLTTLFPEPWVQENIRRHLPTVLSALEEEGIEHPNLILVALATIRAESAGFEPIDEYRSASNTAPGGHPYGLYDNRNDLGNNESGDGKAYRGRGFIQLTGRDNYRRYGDRIGVDLIARPELANDPEVAAHLLAVFIKDREQELQQAVQQGDLVAARRLVNGGSHGLGRFHEAIESGRRLMPTGEAPNVASTRSSCNTGQIEGLSRQMLDGMALQDHLVPIEHPLIVVEGDQNNPWLQPDAYRDLVQAVEERDHTLKVNSALRTPMQQHLLHQQWLQGECGISAAAQPPWSNHNSGLAIDIEDAQGWLPYLERHGWRWLGSHDPMHFDYTRSGDSLGAEQVRAFQRLWNRHRPLEPLVIDGIWGPATEAAVNRAPAAGFNSP